MKKQVNRIRKILVAIDFSSYSRPTMEYATEVAKTTNARLLVLNIINQTIIDSIRKTMNSNEFESFSLSEYLPREIGRRKLRLEPMITEIPGTIPLPVEISIGYGRPHVEILKTIDEEDIDFLVFGPKGRSNIHGFLFGSVAEKLFRHSPVPVMSLRSRLE